MFSLFACTFLASSETKLSQQRTCQTNTKYIKLISSTLSARASTADTSANPRIRRIIWKIVNPLRQAANRHLTERLPRRQTEQMTGCVLYNEIRPVLRFRMRLYVTRYLFSQPTAASTFSAKKHSEKFPARLLCFHVWKTHRCFFYTTNTGRRVRPFL